MDVGAAIVANFTASERRACSSFFSGMESTRTQRDALRKALAASGNAGLVEAMRQLFNQMLNESEPIPACLITSATRLLGDAQPPLEAAQ